MFELYVETHWERKCEAKDREIAELNSEMTWVGEIMTVLGRLLSDGEVRSLA